MYYLVMKHTWSPYDSHKNIKIGVGWLVGKVFKVVLKDMDHRRISQLISFDTMENNFKLSISVHVP